MIKFRKWEKMDFDAQTYNLYKKVENLQHLDDLLVVAVIFGFFFGVVTLGLTMAFFNPYTLFTANEIQEICSYIK